MATNSLTLRLVASAGLWIVIGLVGGGLVLSGLFRGSVERSFEARLVVYLESLVAVTEVSVAGEITLARPLADPRFDQPYSGWYWQISRAETLPIRSRSLWDAALTTDLADAAADQRALSATGPDGENLLQVERDITLPDQERPFRYCVAGNTAEIDSEVARFNTILAWSLALLGAGLLLALVIQVRYGLRPLTRMRAALSAVRAGEDSRLAEDFPAEIQPLASELNALLDHNAQVVDRARTHVGNLAHALKTPLAVLVNAADGAGGPLADTVGRQTTAMRRHVDHYLSRARTAARRRVIGARTELAPVVDDLARTLQRIHRDKDLRIDTDLGDGLVFRGERQDLEEMLGNLMDNGCKWARSRIQVTATAEAGRLGIRIDDDGPGLDAAEREAVFTRGNRIDESVPGSGLGLAIVRDIAELYGGHVTLDAGPDGGLRAELDLPGLG